MGGKKTLHATIKDVAKCAGTSTATVSYVLRGDTNRPISPELRQRVLDAVQELNYTKSAVASSLRTKQRRIILILIPQFNNIYFTRVCESIEDVVFSYDFMPYICDTREEPERERKLLENAIAQRVDGVILGPSSAGWENTALLRKMNIPYVIIGRELAPSEEREASDFYYVGDDSYHAGFLAGKYLTQKGHRHIGVIEWISRVSSAVERDMGFYDAINKQVKQGDMIVESSDKLSVEEGYRMTKALMERANPTALFFGYHRYAQGGVQYLTKAGYSIPEDISVIMVGTPAWADMSSPRYNRIYQHEEWVGTTAGQILMAMIHGEQSPLLVEKRHVCPCTLLDGTSVKDLTK